MALRAVHRDDDEYDDDHTELLRLASRAEFDGRPPETVAAWLAERGIAPD